MNLNHPFFRSRWSRPILWIIGKWVRFRTRYAFWKLIRTFKKLNGAFLEAGAEVQLLDHTIRKDILSSPYFIAEREEDEEDELRDGPAL